MPKSSKILAIVLCAGSLFYTAACIKESPEGEPLTPLVAALGNQRPLESRLTGGFSYAPCLNPSTSRLEHTRCVDLPERISPRAVTLAIAEITQNTRRPYVRLQAEAIAHLAAGMEQ